MSQKIIPNLWFDGAKEAVDFYTSLFPHSKIVDTAYYPESTEEGLADFQLPLAGKELSIEFELDGFRFVAINAAPEFIFNTSISLMVNFDPSTDEKASAHLDELWEKLSEGGEVLMALQKYPYSEKYGWVKDRYGLTWQLILTNPEGEPRPSIIPSFKFSGDVVNRAEEAVNFYASLFDESRIGTLARYPDRAGPANTDSLMFSDFALAGQWFAAMDSAVEQDFSFNEAFSLQINCKDQAEIDYFFEKLSRVPEAAICGWVKDQFGVSWQIVPENMAELMEKPGAYAKMMEMQKIVIDEF